MTRYYLQSRNNQTLTVIDPSLEDYESFKATLRFNGMSTWALTMRRESQYAKTFISDKSGALNNGLLLFVDNEDGLPPVQLLSGPQDVYTMSRKEDSSGPLLVSGYSDEYWLQKRLALPCPHYPLIAFYSRATNLGGPSGGGMTSAETVYGIDSGQVGMSIQRYYPCLDASGTTCTDYGPAASNATYVGGCTLGQPSIVDDPNPCVLLNGSTGYISVNTGLGLNNGNNPWLMFGWFYATALPTSGNTMNALSFGKSPATAKQTVSLYIDSSGLPHCFCQGGSDVTGATAITLGQPIFFVLMYDGTNLSAWMNGSQFATQNPSPLSITINSINYGAYVDGTSTWKGYAGHGGFLNGNLTTAMIQQMYVVGLSRHAYNSFDNNGGGGFYPGSPNPVLPGKAFPAASTGLIYYVQRNLAASASPYAGFGAAAPVATFTSQLGTKYARAIPSLVCASDSQVGGKVYASARFDPTLVLLQALALQSSPEIGFRLVQVGQQLQFQTYLPTDKTASAVFSLDRGNLRSYDWQYGRSSANYLHTGGLNPSTSLQSRLFGEAGDATSISQFGLIEDFYDYRKTSDTVTLANVIGARLLQLKSKRNLNAVVNDTPGLYFAGPGAKGYNLGDRVTVLTEDGQVYTDIVREVGIELIPGQPAKITPAIGTPIDAQVLSEFDTIVKRFKDDGISIDLMQNNY